MIDSLLFLPDVDRATADGAAVDGACVDSASLDLLDLEAPPDHIPRDDEGDAAAAAATAAVAASRDGHAHALRAAWVPAAAALERSAVARDTLVRDGLAGPLVAARGWSDLATVRAAAGDLDGAKHAYARATGAARHVMTVPPDLELALDEVRAALGHVMPSVDEERAGSSGGLLWLDTTDDAPVAEPRAPEAAIPALPTPMPARIAAVDAAVALAAARPAAARATRGLAARVRRLLRR